MRFGRKSFVQNVRGLSKHESPYLILISPSAIYRPNANPKKLHKRTATEPRLAAWGPTRMSQSLSQHTAALTPSVFSKLRGKYR